MTHEQSPHERRVAEFEEQGGRATEQDPAADPGRRPTSDEDLAADRGATEQEPEDLDR